jgi:MFS family permease
MYIPAIVAVAEHFTERRSLALGKFSIHQDFYLTFKIQTYHNLYSGICVCGTGIGTFVVAPLEAVILSSMGWRWTLVVLSGMCIICLACSATMSPVQNEDEEDGSTPIFYPGTKTRSLLQQVGCCILGEELFYHPNLPTFLIVALADVLGKSAKPFLDLIGA